MSTTNTVACASSRSTSNNKWALWMFLALIAQMHLDGCRARGVAYDNDDNYVTKSERSPPPPQMTSDDVIPLSFYEELDNITTMNEFIERFVDLKDVDPQLGIQGKRNVERASAIIPKAANCIPENTIVSLSPLNPSKDPRVMYYPHCTRVKRCGGCCSSELMSCQPLESEILNFEITKYQYASRPSLRGKEIVPVEQHTKCACGCRIKAKDCNSYQVYRPELCRCTCTNNDAFEKCLTHSNKIWDERSCRCVCPEAQTCTTGTTFDENQCKCVDPVQRSTPSPVVFDRRRFIVKAIQIDPITPDQLNNSTTYTV